VTLLASRVDALAQRLDKVATPSVTSVGPSMGTYAYCETCGVQGHTSVELKILQVHDVAVASNRQVRVVSTRNLLPTTRTNLATQGRQSQLEFWN